MEKQNLFRRMLSMVTAAVTSANYDAWGGANGTNSIVDHCSLGWANDEQWGLYSACDNFTV